MKDITNLIVLTKDSIIEYYYKNTYHSEYITDDLLLVPRVSDQLIFVSTWKIDNNINIVSDDLFTTNIDKLFEIYKLVGIVGG